MAISRTGETPLSHNAGDMRAAVAVGGYLPTGELPESGTTDIATTTVSQYKSIIPGFRAYFDYQVTDWMFINYFSEHQFRLKGDATLSAGGTDYEGKFTPGMKNHFELDFSFNPTLAEKLELDSGVKVMFITTAKGKYSDFDVEALNTKTMLQREYKVEPYLGVFYRGWAIPVKGIMSYATQLEGQNVNKMSTITARVEAYLKF